MRMLVAGLLMAIVATGAVHAQQRVTVPLKEVTTTETVVEKREVRKVKTTGPTRVHRVRCKDGSVHRNKSGACRAHGGVQKRYWTKS